MPPRNDLAEPTPAPTPAPLRRTRTLRFRLGAWHFATVALVAIALTAYYHHNFSELSRREAEERLHTLARAVAQSAVLGALAHSEELLAGALEGALGHPDVERAAILTAQGELLAARGRASAPADAWDAGPAAPCAPCTLDGDRLRWRVPIVRATAAAPAGAPAGTAADEGAGFYQGPPPAQSDGAPVGVLVLDASTRRWRESERRLALRAALIALATLAAGLLITLYIARRLTSPLRDLAEATRAIGKGNWGARLPLGADGEIGQLAEDFRHMVEELAALDADNQRHRDTLAERVAERTRELEEAYNRVKAMAEAKDQFVATVSHDFRSPLAIIQSALQTLMQDPAMPPETRQRFLTRAERQCKRLSAMVHDLLDLARIEHREASAEPVLLDELIAEAIDAQRPAFEDKGVRLEYAPPDAPVRAEGDPHYLARAIANLLDNALKFTPAGGRVQLQLGADAGWAFVRVADTGPGIPPEEQERVFDRFYQGATAAASGRGAGLGLAIVAGVARRHGGRAKVESTPGQGATFEITIPQSVAPPLA